METKGFLQFEIIINVLVIYFCFIWIPMLWVYLIYEDGPIYMFSKMFQDKWNVTENVNIIKWNATENDNIIKWNATENDNIIKCNAAENDNIIKWNVTENVNIITLYPRV